MRLRQMLFGPGSSRGDTAVEYIVLVGTIAIPVIPAFILVVREMVTDLNQMQAMVLIPFP